MKQIDQTQLIDLIREILPEPVQEEVIIEPDSEDFPVLNWNPSLLTLTGGDPGEVVASIHISDTLSISEFCVRWDGPHTPKPFLRPIATIHWKNLTSVELTSTLKDLIKLTQKKRRKKYRKCNICKEKNPPEWMHDRKTCQSCAEEHRGVVH